MMLPTPSRFMPVSRAPPLRHAAAGWLRLRHYALYFDAVAAATAAAFADERYYACHAFDDFAATPRYGLARC